MEKKHIAAAHAMIDEADHRALALIVMDKDGGIKCFHAGNDGDLCVMAGISEQTSKLKMLGFKQVNEWKQEAPIADQSKESPSDQAKSGAQ